MKYDLIAGPLPASEPSAYEVASSANGGRFSIWGAGNRRRRFDPYMAVGLGAMAAITAAAWSAITFALLYLLR